MIHATTVSGSIFCNNRLKSSPSSSSPRSNSPHYYLRHISPNLEYCGYQSQQGGLRVLPRRLKRDDMSDSNQPSQPNPSSLGRMACSFCRRRKLKCDRRTPCESCQKFGFDCKYATGISSGSSRPDLKSSRVRQLEDRLGQL